MSLLTGSSRCEFTPTAYWKKQFKKINISEKKTTIKNITSVLKPTNNRRIFYKKNLWKANIFLFSWCEFTPTAESHILIKDLISLIASRYFNSLSGSETWTDFFQSFSITNFGDKLRSVYLCQNNGLTFYIPKIEENLLYPA